jgi:hypothetical protein
MVFLNKIKIVLFCFTLLGGELMADNGSRAGYRLRPNGSSENIKVFSSDYLALGIARNFPADLSKETFERGYLHPVLSYHHVSSDRWMNGIGVQFKMLRYKDDKRNLAILTISQESLIIVRLHHPSYLLLGSKLFYLYPAQRSSLPLQSDPKLGLEIGIGLSAGFLYTFAEKWTLSFYVDRWRGTKTRKIQGLETGARILYHLN